MLKVDNANGFYIFALRVSAHYNLRSGRILRASSHRLLYIRSYMIASRSGRPELYFPSNTKKSALSPVSFPTSLHAAAKETNTQTHFQQPQVYFINRHSRKKNEPVHHSRTRKPRKTNYGKIGDRVPPTNAVVLPLGF